MAAEHPEALAQLTRLLGEAGLRNAPADIVSAAIDSHFDRLVDGLVAEAAANDDVVSREAALLFFDDRLRFLSPLISSEQSARLRDALAERTAAW